MYKVCTKQNTHLFFNGYVIPAPICRSEIHETIQKKTVLYIVVKAQSARFCRYDAAAKLLESLQ